MKIRYLIILIGILAATGTAYVIYSEIPRYGATVTGIPRATGICEEEIQHGFFSEVPMIEELIMDHINNQESRLALEIPFHEMDSHRNFMLNHFGDSDAECFWYEYEENKYPTGVSIGHKSYFTHSFFP